MQKPLAVDLCCGLGGWTHGLLAGGYHVIGADIERHVYGDEKYPGSLWLQDIHTLDGAQFASAALIVASPPCQFFSYTAMPWSRAKALAAEVRSDPARLEKELLIFNACFRIQREASAAAGRHIPMVVENVRGARPWFGPAAGNYGSFYFWGDVPALLPKPFKAARVPGFRFDGSGRSFQTASVDAHKTIGHVNVRDGHSHTRHLTNSSESEGRKHGGDWFRDPTCPSQQGGQIKKKIPAEGRKGAGTSEEGFDGNLCVFSSNSVSRKAASAKIAKIPYKLARFIAAYHYPKPPGF